MKAIQSVFKKIELAWNQGKLRFFSLLSCYLLCAALIITMPLFTYRDNLNNVTVALAILFGAVLLIYLICFGEIYFDFYTVCFVCYLAMSLVSTIVGSKYYSSWRTILTTTILGVSLFQFCASRRSFVFAPSCFLLASWVLCISIFVEYRDYILSFDIDRLGSEFGDLNDVGLMISTGGLFALYLTRRTNRLLFKAVSAISCVIFGIFIFLTGSRGALLIFLFSIFVFLIISFWSKHKAITLTAIGVIFLATIVFLNMPFMADLKERIINAFASVLTLGGAGDGSASKRLQMLFEGLELWTRNPIIGNGAGSFSLLSNQNTFSHSGISELFCSYGLIGAFLWIAPIVFYSTRGNHDAKSDFRLFSLGFMLPASFVFVITQSKFPLASYGVFCGICFAESLPEFSFMRIKLMPPHILKIDFQSKTKGLIDVHFTGTETKEKIS